MSHTTWQTHFWVAQVGRFSCQPRLAELDTALSQDVSPVTRDPTATLLAVSSHPTAMRVVGEQVTRLNNSHLTFTPSFGWASGTCILSQLSYPMRSESQRNTSAF
ncbi:hypothetical protein [Spirosoma migulaei]